jgi:hypothetical protein
MGDAGRWCSAAVWLARGQQLERVESGVPTAVRPNVKLTKQLHDEPRQVGVEAGGIGRGELVQPPPASGPELPRIELDGPAGVGVAHVPEADVDVPRVQPTGHALGDEQRLAR